MVKVKSSHWRCSMEKADLRNFAIITGKHFYWSYFLIKLLGWSNGILFKSDSNAGVFLWIFHWDILVTYRWDVIRVYHLRLRGDVLMKRRCYVFLRRRYDVPIRRRGHVPRRRLGDVPSRPRWDLIWDVPATSLGHRETSLRRRRDVSLPRG